MANFPKRSKLPAPPTPIETKNNLSAPEMAPLSQTDGRSLRATGRTEQINTRVSETFHHELKIYSARHKLKMNELLEMGFAALRRERGD